MVWWLGFSAFAAVAWAHSLNLIPCDPKQAVQHGQEVRRGHCAEYRKLLNHPETKQCFCKNLFGEKGRSIFLLERSHL